MLFRSDVLIILSFYVSDMKRQLEELGVKKERVYHFYNLHRLINVKKHHKILLKYGDFFYDGRKTKILLLNQNLSIGGPAFTLFDCARILKKYGYYVVYGSMLDGPLREKLLQEGIPVIIDENLLVGTMRDSEWIQEYDIVFCNAINFYVFLSDRDISIPMIWWLHDSKFFYEGVDREVISKISGINLSVYAVGSVPERVLREYAPELRVTSLLYGVKKKKLIRKKVDVEDQIVCFVTVGFVEVRKGQDILVEAILSLPKNVRKQCRFYIIGKNTSVLARNLEKKVKDIPEIIFTGVVEDVYEYLSKADVLICPSREDPMPAVCVEAMMYELPCLISDSTGTATYIREKVNGLIFQNSNIDELERQIVWCVENRQRLSSIGKSSEKIYEENFAMNIFERNLLKAIEKMSKKGDK